MGKSFKGFSKALSLILAAAMVVSCVPTSAYAAELLTVESDELLTSNDVVEAGETLTVDDSTESIEDTQDVLAEDSADIMDENMSGKGAIPSEKSTGDVTLKIFATDEDVKVLNPDSRNGNIPFTAEELSAISWDSTKDLELTVVPAEEGSLLDGESKLTVTYKDGTTPVDVAEASTGYGWSVARGGLSATLTISSVVLSKYKEVKGTEFTVAFVGKATKADTYVAEVIGTNNIPEGLRTVACGESKDIPFKDYEKLSDPITNVAVYVGDPYEDEKTKEYHPYGIELFGAEYFTWNLNPG